MISTELDEALAQLKKQTENTRNYRKNTIPHEQNVSHSHMPKLNSTKPNANTKTHSTSGTNSINNSMMSTLGL